MQLNLGIQILNLITLKRIFTLSLLFAFQFVVFAQENLTSGIITNPGFEDGANTDWTLVINNPAALATLTDAGAADAFTGVNAGKIDITNKTGIWELWLQSPTSTMDYSGKELEISFTAKKISADANIQKVMLKVVNADTDANITITDGTECWFAAEDVYQTFTRTVTIPAGTPNIQIRVWCGQQNGVLFFDDFLVTGEAVDSNLLTGTVSINGDAVKGEILTTTVSDANSSALNYQWKRNDVIIDGSTQSSYTILAEDVDTRLSVEVTADDKEGGISDETGIVLESAFQFAVVVEKLKKGVNQDASLAYSGTFQKVQHERAHMEAIKEAGFESVRIFLPYNADYTKFESRIQDALDYDLAVVVCMWGANTWAGDINTGITQFTTKWEQITQAWKSKFSNDLVFELLNEPEGIGFVNESSYPDVMALYNAAIPAIRAIDGDRPILVGMPGHNDSEYMDPWVTETYLDYVLGDASSFFEDPNIGISIHFYRPNGSDGNNWAFYTAPQLNVGWEATIDVQLDYAVNWQTKYNTTMPVVVTEWGCWLFESRNNSTDLVDWLDYHMDKFEEYGFGNMWYTGVQNNQRSFGIFDSELGWNQVVLDKLTGVTDPFIPSTSQIIDAEFLSWGSETWKLSTATGVTKSFVNGVSALSGSHSLKLAVSGPTDCQMYQRTLTVEEDGGQAPGRTLIHLIQGETYEVSFMAKAENSNGELKILLKDANNLGTLYYQSEVVEIATTSNTYSLNYTHTASTEMDVRFEFDIGSKAQTLILDKVSLKRKSDNLSTDKYSISEVKMYPNPTNGILNIETIKEIQQIEVMDLTGKTLSTVRNKNSINIESLAPGIYVVRIGLNNNESIIQKVIKR